MRERGSAMLTAVVSVMVLLLISGIFFSFVNSQFRMQTAEERALRAYYLAEAGTNYGIANMKNKINASVLVVPFPSQITGYDNVLDNPFGLVYGGQFEVHIDPILDTTLDLITIGTETGYIITAHSTGVYQGITRKLDKDYLHILP